jgi:hypothetical protein
VHVAVASSSRNCALVLKLAGLEGLFETRVDGVVSRDLNLKGKPDPDIFVTAARMMGLWPGECVVVEDAISGVQAGRAGNFGLTIGIAESTDGQMLRRFGADMVVRDLSELGIGDLEDWFEKGIEQDGWNLLYQRFDPGDEKLRETLTTVGNGYLGTRGCFEGERSSFSFYPGTYIAGIYNKVPSQVEGRTIYNNDFVNCPNWLPVEFRIGKGEYVSPLSMDIYSYRHCLDMREGVMERTIVAQDNLGRLTRIHSKRMASMDNPHLCALSFELTPAQLLRPDRLPRLDRRQRQERGSAQVQAADLGPPEARQRRQGRGRDLPAREDERIRIPDLHVLQDTALRGRRAHPTAQARPDGPLRGHRGDRASSP